MNNMYDILNKMKLLEGKGSKPDFLDIDKDGNKTEPMKQAAKEVDEASYSAKAARAGKDIGKPGKAFAQIAKSAGERYGSKERGEKVAGAVLAKLRAKEDVNEADVEEGNEFTQARVAAIKAGKPTFKVGNKVYKVTGDTQDEKVMEREYYSRDDFDSHAKAGDTYKPSKKTQITKTAHGLRHEKIEGDYDDEEEVSDTPKKKGRPKGTGKKLGAKGPSGKSKLLKKGSIKESDLEEDADQLVDKGEYDREGDMAKEQLHTIEAAAKELHDILGDDQNLPEWVQSKITKAMDYIDTARDYMLSQDAEQAEMMPERKLSSSEKEEREDIVKGMKKNKGDFEKRYGKRGEEVMYATATKMAKERGPGNPARKKKEESVEETTVAGSVATAPAEASKGKKGMQFGKGVYEGAIAESFNSKLKTVLTEGMSININVDENGTKSLNVSATDDDAVKLAQILKLAGMEQAHGYEDACPACGSSSCGCQDLEEGDLANSPEPEYSDTDTMVNTLSGGLNGPKTTGQATIPVLASQTERQMTKIKEETEGRLWDLYKHYEGK